MRLEIRRFKIAFIDFILISLLGERMRTALVIEKQKRRLGMPIFNKSVEEGKKAKACSQARKSGLDEGFAEFIKKIFTLTLDESRRLQEKQRSKEKDGK